MRILDISLVRLWILGDQSDWRRQWHPFLVKFEQPWLPHDPLSECGRVCHPGFCQKLSRFETRRKLKVGAFSTSYDISFQASGDMWSKSPMRATSLKPWKLSSVCKYFPSKWWRPQTKRSRGQRVDVASESSTLWFQNSFILIVQLQERKLMERQHDLLYLGN